MTNIYIFNHHRLGHRKIQEWQVYLHVKQLWEIGFSREYRADILQWHQRQIRGLTPAFYGWKHQMSVSHGMLPSRFPPLLQTANQALETANFNQHCYNLCCKNRPRQQSLDTNEHRWQSQILGYKFFFSLKFKLFFGTEKY